jgi:hypothetical protein
LGYDDVIEDKEIKNINISNKDLTHQFSFETIFIKWKTGNKSEYSKYYFMDSEHEEVYKDNT